MARIACTLLSVFFSCGFYYLIYWQLNIHDFDFQSVSALKTSILALLLSVGGYFLISTVSPKLLRINSIIILNLLLSLLGIELGLRLIDHRLPYAVIELLPSPDRARLMKQRGMFVSDDIAGDKMLYSWKPGSSFKNLPWLKIDQNGYRNPSYGGQADIILLGDSVTIAQNSGVDLGDAFRRLGHSALNLGFGGYGVNHYRDVYQKYVVEPGIPHSVVLVNFCYCNDIQETISYEQVVNSGGNWEDYTKPTASRVKSPVLKASWASSILFQIPYRVVQAYKDQANAKDDLVISLPRGEITLKGADWTRPVTNYSVSDWRKVDGALRTIAQKTRAVGASLIIAYFPNLHQIYLPHIPRSKPVKAEILESYQKAIERLKLVSDDLDVAFFDYTPAIQKANLTMLVTEHDADYHPNGMGVEIMKNAVRPLINELLGKNGARHNDAIK